MARKNFRATGGIDIDTSSIPTSIIQETITSNSATTVDTIALNAFLSAEYTVTLTQGSKIRTSKVLVQTDGTNVDMTEFGIVETGGTMTGVAVTATTASTNAILQITVTDAATTLVRYKLVRNLTTIIGYAPDAPTNVVATYNSETQTVSVSFTAPIDTGNSSITSYRVLSNTGNFTNTGSSSPITVTATSGTYTFTVTATNQFGTSSSSSASNSVVVPDIPKATGGTITTDSNYFYHTFTSSGTFAPLQALTADWLIVAGGGGGTYSYGAGGAGGYRTSLDTTSVSLLAQNYTVTVGAGGSSGGSTGSNGNNSSAFGFSSTGGASTGFYGAGTVSTRSGGSGHGARSSSTAGQTNFGSAGNAGNYTPPEGYDGGTSIGGAFSNQGTGGGGGAGGPGGNANSSGAGSTGGIGRSTNSQWGLVTSTGHNVSGTVFYAGGGGGARGSAGGSGGGGSGGTFADPSTGGQAQINTGGGGGAGFISGMAGGSGIVIVRYAK